MNHRRIMWLAVFGMAMGFFEAAVVIYLRMIYYPAGFEFPLAFMDPNVGFVELLREGATLLMLVGLAMASGNNASQRLAVFIGAFAIWDLFYYIFLKILIGWPASFFTWDILFLIPVPWIGPVITPCLVCLTMLLFAAVLLRRDQQRTSSALLWGEWVALWLAGVLLIFTWTWDFFTYSLATGAEAALTTYTPQSYNWLLYAVAQAGFCAVIVHYWRRTAPVRNG